jgi:hypothetical protein
MALNLDRPTSTSPRASKPLLKSCTGVCRSITTQVHGAPGFTARLVSEQVAQAELANLIRDGGQR